VRAMRAVCLNERRRCGGVVRGRLSLRKEPKFPPGWGWVCLNERRRCGGVVRGRLSLRKEPKFPGKVFSKEKTRD
jgi:hypothetical protein